MRTSDTLSNIAAAMCKIQAEIKNPLKDKANEGVRGNPLYSTLEDTLQIYVRPICSKHGVSVIQSLDTDESGKVGVKTMLLHESGEFIESDEIKCEVKVPLSKEGKPILTEGQATGVVVTYLRRYSLNSMLGVNGDRDSDGSYSTLQQIEPPSVEQALKMTYRGITLEEMYKSHRADVAKIKFDKAASEQLKMAVDVIDKYIAESTRKKAEAKHNEVATA